MMRRLYSLIACFLSVGALSQTILPDYGPMFLQDEVATVRVQIHEDSLALILHPDSIWSNHEYPATFIYETSEFTDTVENIGFRLRGNTSREGEKKSFKVSFNTFNSGGDYQGLEKLNLNGEANDPAILRSRLCWEIFRGMGVAGSRTSHVRLYINDEYRGAYLNVEHIDEVFADRYFDNGSGNLFKCLYPANLHYIDDDPESYKLEVFGRRVYSLKSNTYEDDYSKLANFIDILNNTPTEDMQCALETVFNVQDYLRIAAVDVVIGNWDGYIFNNNNFYLYENQKTGRLEYIPYDLDNTLGIDWYGEDWSDRNIYEWQSDWDFRPLYEQLLAVEEYRNAFSFYIDEVIQNFVGNDVLYNRAHELQDLIQDAALEDPFRPLDYGFSEDDFLDAIDTGWGEHVWYSIGEFAEIRTSSAQDQLEPFTEPLFANHLRDNSPEFDTIAFKLSVDNQSFNAAEIKFQINDGDWQALDLLDDGLNQDWEAGDGLYGALLPIQDDYEKIEYQARIEWPEGELLLPCDTVLIWVSPAESDIVLNELMASNSSTIFDEYGEADDWSELFNGGDDPVTIGNKYLTDDLDDPDKWQLPNVTMEPGTHRLLWNDNDPEQGPFHSNFKLKASGEELALYQIEDGALRLIDWIQFGEQSSDISYGRSTDGAEDWVFFEEPTPDAPNGIVNVDERSSSPFQIYPNPTMGLVYFSETLDVKVLDTSGKLIENCISCSQMDLSQLASGIYLLQSELGVQRLCIR